MSDAEQRGMIRAGITEVEDLPEEFRREVEEMLANHRRSPRSARCHGSGLPWGRATLVPLVEVNDGRCW